MALEVMLPALGNQFLDKVGITEDGEYTYPIDEEITTGDLLNIVDRHNSEYRVKYEKERKYFRGDHEIMRANPKPEYKPDNRLIFNFPRKAVTTFNGFFMGNPVGVDSRRNKAADTFISDWRRASDFDAVTSDVSKMASIYGHAFYMVYQSSVGPDEMPEPKITAVSPLNAFIIYDDTFEHKVKYGVTYRRNYKHELEITLYDELTKRELLLTDGTGNYLDQVRVTANPYRMVPLIEVDENSERMALCEDIVTLIDQLNQAMSEKANDVDYFADAILKITGATIDKNTYKEMRSNRMLNITGADASSVDAEFMGKPDSDNAQEHLVNRLVQSIYEISNVTNLNDDAFNGSPSGVALKLKFQAMDNMARTKTLKFKHALRQLFKAVFTVSSSQVDADSWRQLDFTFKRSTPVNLLEESQALAGLAGNVSKRTMLGQLSFIDDPDEELKQIQKEKDEAMQQANTVMQQALVGAQTDQQKAGVVDDKPEAGTEADSPTDKPGRADK